MTSTIRASIGQLDVRAYLKQYGERKNADDVSSAWQGGAYVTFHRKNNADKAEASADHSRSGPPVRFAVEDAAGRRTFRALLCQRGRAALSHSHGGASAGCSGAKCPVSSAQILTEEGPVIIEHWADNTVLVSESFDSNTAAKVHEAVRDGAAHAENSPQNDWQIYPQGEIGLRLYDLPAFRTFAESIGAQIAQEIASSSGQ